MARRSRGYGAGRPARVSGWILLVVAFLMPVQGVAQVNQSSEPYRLRVGDLVQVSVPGHPELSLEVALDETGRVPIPQVGDVSLKGLTLPEAQSYLRQRLRLFDPTLDRIVVELAHGGTFNVFVMGSVGSPGNYSFPVTPTMWDVLRAAGGPLDSANLRAVRVVREENGTNRVFNLDLSGLLLGSPVPDFELKSGDSLMIPAQTVGVSSVPTADGVKVFGGVAVPTVVDIEAPTRLLDVLMLAGAPTATAELKKVNWVHTEDGEIIATKLNLRDYLEYGDLQSNPLVYPGDTVEVGIQQEGFIRRTVPFLLASVAAFMTIWLAYDRIRE